MAVKLGCAQAGTAPDVIRRAVRSSLYNRDRWLLVFDNAKDPGALREWLPSGPGHVLITSRSSGWVEDAVPVPVDVFSRDESVRFLETWALETRRLRLEPSEATRLAEALGDLPLALAQAAAYLDETGLTVGRYVDLLADRVTELLDQGRSTAYGGVSHTAAVTLTYDQLRAADEDAADLASICAFLAPEPIRDDWLAAAAGRLPGGLAGRLADPVARGPLLSALTRSSLARRDAGGLSMHRLTQGILRSYPGQRKANNARKLAEDIVVANRPPRDQAPEEARPTWTCLLPHILALDPGHTGSSDLRAVAQQGAWYLTDSGNAEDALDLATRLYEQWRTDLGADHPQALQIANTRGRALRELGRYGEARALDEDTYARYRLRYGDNYVDTMTLAHSLASDLRALREYDAASELDQKILERRCLRLGADHPSTLRSASNLAADWYGLGDFAAARKLDADTFERRRRRLGADHPDTLISANNLANDLRALGDFAAALAHDKDTLERRRRVLGEDHPLTRRSAENLARDRRPD
jgi:hypothetical protein